LRQRHCDPVGAQDRFERRRQRSRLVGPLRVSAHQRTEVDRRVYPVDPGAPLHGVQRPYAAQQQDRNAVAPRIEDRHRRVHHPDIGMQRDGERLARDAHIPVRERDRGLFVHAEQQFRARVAEMVDQAVVQPAKAGARRERDIGNLERAQEVGDRIASETRDRLRLRSGPPRIVHARFARA
jgi:hypothetical protein